MTTELHPLGFFLPENTRLLMLGVSRLQELVGAWIFITRIFRMICGVSLA